MLRVTLPAVLAQRQLMQVIVDYADQFPSISLTLNFSDSRHGSGALDVDV